MGFLVALDHLEKLVRMEHQEKLDGPVNEGIEAQKDNRVKWVKLVNEVQQDYEDLKVNEAKMENLVILDAEDNVDEKVDLVLKDQRDPWDWLVMLE